MLSLLGYENYIEADLVVAVLSPNSSPARKLKSKAAEQSLLVDATAGKKTRSLILLATGHVVQCSVIPQTLRSRIDEARRPVQIAATQYRPEPQESLTRSLE